MRGCLFAPHTILSHMKNTYRPSTYHSRPRCCYVLAKRGNAAYVPFNIEKGRAEVHLFRASCVMDTQEMRDKLAEMARTKFCGYRIFKLQDVVEKCNVYMTDVRK